jgi:membrane protease subunit HflK
LKEYKKAPEVTRKRLYLETMESVLNKTGKVIVDSENANNLMYLPLDQLMKQSSGARRLPTTSNSNQDSQSGSAQGQPARPSRKTRETR